MTAVLATGSGTDKVWRISIHQGLVLIKFQPGAFITHEILKSVYDELNADPQKYRITNVVYDLRDIVPDPNAGFKEMVDIVEHVKANRQDWWKHDKTAYVVSGKFSYGMARMYATLGENKLGHQVNIFDNDLEAAIKWAKLPADPA